MESTSLLSESTDLHDVEIHPRQRCSPCGLTCFHCLQRWRNWIKPLVFFVYLSLLVVALPLMIVEFQMHDLKAYIQAWFIGGMFVLMALPISFWAILQHVVNYTQPFLQRYIIRIIWMVPIYAVNAWFALRFKSSAIYMDTVRECYEAYVIYNFLAYLMNFLRSEYSDLERTISLKPQVKHLIPFCLLPPWKMGRTFISRCKHGALQYTVIRPLTAIIAFFCEWAGVYNEGDFDFRSAWSYLVIFNNISQIWAMYCLILFYKACKEELAPIKPVSKFLCIKFVIFFSFWQGVLIAILVKTGVIQEDKVPWFNYTVQDVTNGIQDFLICIEMFIAAIAHYFSFSHKPYIDNAALQPPCCASFLSMWDVSDIREDVVDHVKTVGKTVTKPLRSIPPSSYSSLPRGPPPVTQYGSINSTEDEQPEILSRSPLLTTVNVHVSGPTNTEEHSNVQVTGPGNMDDNASIRTFDSCSTDLTSSIRTFQQKVSTASMNNFMQFDSSYDSTCELVPDVVPRISSDNKRTRITSQCDSEKSETSNRSDVDLVRGHGKNTDIVQGQRHCDESAGQGQRQCQNSVGQSHELPEEGQVHNTSIASDSDRINV